MDPILTFTHHDRTYTILPAAAVDWRRRLGYKPRWPYVLVGPDGTLVNGVSKADLAWYRQKYADASGADQS